MYHYYGLGFCLRNIPKCMCVVAVLDVQPAYPSSFFILPLTVCLVPPYFNRSVSSSTDDLVSHKVYAIYFVSVPWEVRVHLVRFQ